ncbi:helix-turn-helix domain-containing protein [Comamonas aquatica]|uniref:helix-turn-helix domain-containing protein n=1 Tax=Comamonas aquatica TaxID=225991 RepID=UPI00391D6569
MSEVTAKYVESIEARFGKSTVKDLGDLLGVTKMSISRYRNKQKGFSDEVAIRAAELLGLDAGIVLGELYEERASTPMERAAWRHIRELAANAAKS